MCFIKAEGYVITSVFKAPSIVVFYVCLVNMFSVLRQTVSTTQFRRVFYSQMQKKNNAKVGQEILILFKPVLTVIVFTLYDTNYKNIDLVSL